MTASELTELEGRFRRTGLVSFCRRNHLRPAATLALLAGVVSAIEAIVLIPAKEWPLVVDVAVASTSALLLALAIWTLSHFEKRVRRSFGRYLTEVGFVIVPAALVALLDTLQHAGEIAVLNIVLLSLYTLEERLGLSYVVRWAVGFAYRELRSSWRHLRRAVPLLTVVLLAMFLAGETWQIAAGFSVWNLAAVSALFLVAGTFAGGQHVAVSHAREAGLSSWELRNVGALMGTATASVAFTAALTFALFLGVVGALSIDEALLESWLGHRVGALTLTMGLTVTLSWELVRVMVLMLAIAHLVFSATLAADAEYRQSSAAALAEDVERSLMLRQRYRELLEL